MAYSADYYVQLFLAHRKALESLLDTVPEAQGDFKPWEGAMSFQSMTDHLTGASMRFSAMATGKSPEAFAASSSFGESRDRLKASTEATATSLRGLNDEQLESLIDAFGTKMPVFALIDIMREHEAHHKGQLWTMARMIGLEPGRFIQRG